jgi:hypothetical protein
LFVSTSGSSAANCATLSTACLTIQEGITAAEADVASDVTIDVAAGTYSENDTINVPAGDTLTLQGAAGDSPTVNGGASGSVFTVTSGNVTIDDFNVINGAATTGGGIDNQGTITLSNDTFSGDTATAAGGGIDNEAGGSATLSNDTLFSDSGGTDGGGIDNQGTITLSNDTFSGDTATTGGGGIDNEAGGSATLANSIVNNSPCQGSVGDGGYNVESDSTCASGSTDVTNSSVIDLATSLAANGTSGPETLAIGRSSSAFEEVPAANCTISSDERGDLRPGVIGSNCDAGAFEDQIATATLALTGTPTPGSNTYGVALTVPSGALAPSETVTVQDSSSQSCSASLTEITTTQYSGACTIIGEAAGETITATYNANSADPNYLEATSNVLTVNSVAQVITFTSSTPTSPTVGGSYNVSATGGPSLNPVVFSIGPSSTSGACGVAGSTVSLTGVGTCVVDANQAGNSNYAAAAQVSQSFSILAGTQVITFTSKIPTSPTVGGTYILTATGGKSTNPVIFSIGSSSTTGACGVAGSTVSLTGVGTCVVDANQAGNSNYTAATQVSQSFSILAKGTIVTPPKPPASTPTIVIDFNTFSKSGTTSSESVKLSCRSALCAGQITSTGRITTYKLVSAKSGKWTVTKKVSKTTTMVLAHTSYRIAKSKNKLFTFTLTTGGRQVLSEANTRTPLLETLTATVQGGTTATKSASVR